MNNRSEIVIDAASYVYRFRLVAVIGGILGIITCSAGLALADQPSAKLCTSEPTTTATGVCIMNALNEADKKLNLAYKKAQSVIEQDDRGQDDPGEVAKAKTAWTAQLAAAQRAWMAFRDADCGDLIFSEWNNGHGVLPAVYACRYDKTVQRTNEILSRYPLH